MPRQAILPTLQLRGVERVAAPDRAGLEPGHEPALALLGAAVGEAVGDAVALRPFLERIVADRGRGAHSGFDVAGLEEGRLALAPQVLILVARPDAGEAIRLQLDPHLDLVPLGLADGALRLLRLRQDAEQVLHVMADLVRDHIGLRELAGLAADVAAAEAGGDLVEERGVEIDLLVGRAVERPHRALRDAAAVGPRRAFVENEDRSAVGPALLGEDLLPLHFGAAEHLAHETAHVVLRRTGVALRRRGGPLPAGRAPP